MSTWPRSASGLIMPLSANRTPLVLNPACLCVAGSGTEPIVERQLAVGIQYGRPCLSTALTLENQFPLVDERYTQAIQFGRGHMADIFFVRRSTIHESHDL